jgi:anthranilate phosphoribosyltransferase
MIKTTLNKLFENEDLTFLEAEEVANLLMSGKVNNSQIASLLTALRIKGETANEIAGFANAMRNNGVKLIANSENLIDVCGTGGDNSGSFNISTAVSFVVSGAGINVAKHGNRSITSKSGSSDVLKELGVNIELSPEQSQKALNEIGIAFLFAPIYHPAMKNVAPTRLELGFKTIFNVLGPLTNPANTKTQMIGTYNYEIASKMAEAAKILQMNRVTFVCTNNQFDEITLTDNSQIFEINGNNPVSVSQINANTFNFKQISIEEIKGGTPKENSKIILDILNNQSSEAQFNVVVANAAIALYTSGKFLNISEAQEAATNSIKSGRALEKLNKLVKFGQNYA